MKGWRYPCGLIGALALPGAAFAQAETTTFEYDALGRLTKSVSVQPSGPDETQSFSYDDADNRETRTVSRTASATPPTQPEADEPANPPDTPE